MNLFDKALAAIGAAVVACVAGGILVGIYALISLTIACNGGCNFTGIFGG